MKYSTFIIFLLFYHLGIAQPSLEDQDIDGFIRNFFYKIEQNKIDEAVDELYATNEWLNDYKLKELVKNQLRQFEVNIIGTYYGYDLINQVELNRLFVFRSYLLKYDRQPIRITFGFYKPQNKWHLYSIKIDDNVDEEMEGKLKIN